MDDEKVSECSVQSFFHFSDISVVHVSVAVMLFETFLNSFVLYIDVRTFPTNPTMACLGSLAFRVEAG